MSTYLFDFDGTLVDSMPVYGGVMLRILDEYHIPYPDTILKTITPLGLGGTAEYYVGMGLPRTKEQIVAQMTDYMIDAYTHRVPAKQDVIAVLKELKARGDSLNVLTASPHVTLDPCLRRLGIFDLFDHVWSCEDFGMTKSDTAIYHAAAERLCACVSDVIFLDDNYNADLTAKRAGMQVIGVYDDSSKEYVQEIKGVADRYIYNFKELL